MPAKTPPEEPPAAPVEPTEEAPADRRRGLPDWAWVTGLTALILAAVVWIGRGTIAA